MVQAWLALVLAHRWQLRTKAVAAVPGLAAVAMAVAVAATIGAERGEDHPLLAMLSVTVEWSALLALAMIWAWVDQLGELVFHDLRARSGHQAHLVAVGVRLRIRSTARYRAVVCSQAAGLSGTPSCRHFSIAATKVSCVSSSAVSRSPTNRASLASTRGDSTRHKVATVASMFAALMATDAVEAGPGAY